MLSRSVFDPWKAYLKSADTLKYGHTHAHTPIHHLLMETIMLTATTTEITAINRQACKQQIDVERTKKKKYTQKKCAHIANGLKIGISSEWLR